METPQTFIVREPVTREKLDELASAWHRDMVKGVADCRRGMIALGGNWHIEGNVCLLKDGSSQEDLWGFNVYPAEEGEQALEYISLINIRPAQDNHEMELQHPELREKIKELVRNWLPDLKL
jgi:hypothetical protein